MKERLLLIKTECADDEQLRAAAWISRELFALLTETQPVTWSQILYPYADARSVQTARELGERSLFGTHVLLSGLEKSAVQQAVESVRSAYEKGTGHQSPAVQCRTVARTLSALTAALRCSTTDIKGLQCGNFSELIPSDCADWQIREAARRFASMVDMLESRSGGRVKGLAGGRVLLDCGEDFRKKANEIYEQKTGGRVKARLLK